MSAQTIELHTTTELQAADVAHGYIPGAPLTKHQAEVLTEGIVKTLEAAQDMLRIAFRGKAHEVLGYGKGQAGWDAYFADKFADVVMALPVAARQLEVAKWNDAGASLGVAARALGVSKATVSDDRKVVGQPQNVVSLDGKRRDSVATSVAVVEAKNVAPKKRAVPLTVRIEAMLLEAGRDGLTSADVRGKFRIHHGQSSASMTALEGQRRAFRAGDKRGGYSIYRAMDFMVIDAELVD